VLCLAIQEERLENLKDNEKYVANGGKDSDDESVSDLEDEGEGEQEMQDSEEEYEQTLH